MEARQPRSAARSFSKESGGACAPTYCNRKASTTSSAPGDPTISIAAPVAGSSKMPTAFRCRPWADQWVRRASTQMMDRDIDAAHGRDLRPPDEHPVITPLSRLERDGDPVRAAADATQDRGTAGRVRIGALERALGSHAGRIVRDDDVAAFRPRRLQDGDRRRSPPRQNTPMWRDKSHHPSGHA